MSNDLIEIKEKAMYIFGRGELQTEGIFIGKQFSMKFLHNL